MKPRDLFKNMEITKFEGRPDVLGKFWLMSNEDCVIAYNINVTQTCFLVKIDDKYICFIKGNLSKIFDRIFLIEDAISSYQYLNMYTGTGVSMIVKPKEWNRFLSRLVFEAL